VINCLQHVFDKWAERCKKCIACQGRYLEKETVTARPQIPTWSDTVSPRTLQTALLYTDEIGMLLKSYKLPGIDEIPAELIGAGGKT
jgi:hypothetical protein